MKGDKGMAKWRAEKSGRYHTYSRHNVIMDHGAMEFDLWLEFEVWRAAGDTDDPLDDFFNMSITLSDGSQYALNVWTYRFFERAVVDARSEATYKDTQYLLPPDLFVERLDRKELEGVVRHLIKSDRLKSDWLVRD